MSSRSPCLCAAAHFARTRLSGETFAIGEGRRLAELGLLSSLPVIIARLSLPSLVVSRSLSHDSLVHIILINFIEASC